ncbi:MBL fold metallo-hydrolase [Salisediminibacterium halotolerans]|uniref:L-ascorbate metabolism protein UlaG, beta-lactamase superfamily n=1 Tax=Salisediminibacterium halotolerans TaxID=517425 RepID=A0A1H9SWU7_9BACI|nr:MBL fold metallo-hydrolase [Salisediminibacterium haloalkalitolerans]SER89376.1 L-ascorbate metabolism protein UlaG, beta-lactamase superfamily [Salisediminibacterium haloalkalitolerans]
MLKIFIQFAAVTAAAAAAVVNLHPGFGKSPGKMEQRRFDSLPNRQNGQFVNDTPLHRKLNPCDASSLIKDSLKRKEHRGPSHLIPVAASEWEQEDSITWLGHSAFYLNIAGVKMLLDPMFGPAPAPMPFLAGKRYTGSLLGKITELPEIDVVLLTHDHYDHLDYRSIRRLKEKVRRFVVPLGVGAHLRYWGVNAERISELNWHESASEQDITLTLTPSRHFSGRGVRNRNQTLWGGWVIASDNAKVYASGDGGYGEHFQTLGKQYGPFDLTLMEGGQYDDRWKSVHMRPEEAVQAHKDVCGNKLLLAHWAGFTLAFHSWEEPIERALHAAEQENVTLLTPEVGRTVPIHGAVSQQLRWWQKGNCENKKQM